MPRKNLEKVARFVVFGKVCGIQAKIKNPGKLGKVCGTNLENHLLMTNFVILLAVIKNLIKFTDKQAHE